jgi:hypothetical protein
MSSNFNNYRNPLPPDLLNVVRFTCLLDIKTKILYIIYSNAGYGSVLLDESVLMMLSKNEPVPINSINFAVP